MHPIIYMICNNLPEIILNSNSQTRFSARILDTLPSCTHCGTLAGNALSRLSPSLSPWPTTCPSFSSSDMTSTKVESNRVLCEQIPPTLLTTSSGPNLSSWRSFPTSPSFCSTRWLWERSTNQLDSRKGIATKAPSEDGNIAVGKWVSFL